MSPEEVCIVGIERASKYLFGDEPRSKHRGKNTTDERQSDVLATDPVGMIKMLEDMAQGFLDPETVGELDFNTKYGPSIRAATGEYAECPIYGKY